MIHIHGDIDGLKYFSDKNGVCAYSSRYIAYAMQDSHIVAVFYTTKEIQDYYEHNKHKDNIPILFYWDENTWINRNKNQKLK